MPLLPPVAIVLLALGVTPLCAQTPNAFFQRGSPTFVRGTVGEELTDKALAAQIELITAALFPAAPVVDDAKVDVGKGAEGWPANPVLYGSNEHNAVLGALVERLPFRFRRGGLELGERAFLGSDVRLIACVPARPDEPGSSVKDGWPEFLVYAGAGPLDAMELNGVRHGGDAFLVVDRFGPLVAGTWEAGAKGTWEVSFGEPRRREKWRLSNDVDRGHPRPVFVHHLELVPKSEADEERISAVLRGAERAAERLGLERFESVAVYVHPDKKSKEILTGNGGAGHADAAARTVHVLACDASEGGDLEGLIAHEVTHVIAVEAVGPAASSLLGEGLAVWTSGRYAGRLLADWKKELAGEAPTIAGLFAEFRKLPESVSYPLGGLFVDLVIREQGWESFKTHFAGASGRTWEAACKAAGAKPADLEAAWLKALARK